MKNYILFTLLILIFTTKSFSQELNCTVEVISPTLKSSPENKQILEALQQSVYNLMNSTKWTDDQFQNHEKIECNLLITVNSIKSLKQFEATLQVSSRRPIFNSNYNSPLVNTLDKSFNFNYELNSPLVYSQSAYTDDLSGVLSYYAYYIIGMDYDSYSLEGGTSYFVKAQQISGLAQSSGGSGWDSKDINSRYWIIENVVSAQFKQMRKSVYEYHRLGLDIAYEDPKTSVSSITKAITYLQDVHARQPGSINMRIYFAAKADEVINIYSEADATEKNTVFNIVRRIDPGNIAKYQNIIKK